MDTTVDEPINIYDTDASNRFLRALWSEFKKVFGNCGWQYTPWKDGPNQKISFGFVDVNRPEGALEVGITYKQMGSIRTIFFNHHDDGRSVDPTSDLAKAIRRSIETALTRADLPEFTKCLSKVECLRGPPSYYAGRSFRIVPISQRRFDLHLTVRAYDDPDARTELTARMSSVLDIISVETNSAFWQLADGDRLDNQRLETAIDQTETFAPDPNWMDDYPVENGCYLLSGEGVKLIDWVAAGTFDGNESVSTLLRAFSHFHTARKYAAQVTDLFDSEEPTIEIDGRGSIPMWVRDHRLQVAGQMGAAHAEITGTLYMSALEVASKLGAAISENCEKCGQPQYKISRRVTDLMTECGGEYLGRFAKQYYGQRSGYLHEGLMLTSTDYAGVSIPRLDPSSDSGCLMQISSPSLNLLEYAGYCLRKVLKRIVRNS